MCSWPVFVVGGVVLDDMLLLSNFFVRTRRTPSGVDFGSGNRFGVTRFASVRLKRSRRGSQVIKSVVGRMLSSRGPSLIVFAKSGAAVSRIQRT